MAKNKKTIDDIQKALLSNTSFMKENNVPQVQEPVKENISEPASIPPNMVEINKDILNKIKILAAYEKKTPYELIHNALNHFLRLKSIDLSEAMMKITNDEE